MFLKQFNNQTIQQLLVIILNKFCACWYIKPYRFDHKTFIKKTSRNG